MAMQSEILGRSYPAVVLFEPVPIDIQRGMRTVDLLWRSALGPEPSGLELIQSAAPSVREIQQAARDRQDEGLEPSRLVFVQATNKVTGSSGVIILRQLADGSLSRPLGELVTPTIDLTPCLKQRADRIGWIAKSGRLLLVAYHVPQSPEPGVVFLCEQLEDPPTIRWETFARVFATPFEITQWSGDGPLAADESEDSIN